MPVRSCFVAVIFISGCLPLQPDPPIVPPPEKTPVPTTTNPQTIDELHQAAMDSFANVHSYCARLRRRESRDGKPKPEELVLFKERKSPFSVHFKWIGPEATGREVLYVQGKYGDKLNLVTAAGDVPFTPAGKRISMARDSMFVKAANPNHDITHAGLGHNLRDLSALYAAAKSPQSGVTAKLLGPVQRPECKEQLMGVEIKLPPGRDPDLPRGGSRQVFYCPTTHLPILYLSFDEMGRDFNYNSYDRLQLDLKLDDADFDPDTLWGGSGGKPKAAPGPTVSASPSNPLPG